jgi:EamA-like transporter family.
LQLPYGNYLRRIAATDFFGLATPSALFIPSHRLHTALMPSARTLLLTTLTMLAFAGNSVLCRIALRETGIDAASFTTIRLASGAVVLWLIVRFFRRARAGGGSWLSALMLFAYAAGFSFAYLSLTTATGALLLFGAVQATMICWGLWRGERFGAWQLVGLALAVGGLVGLLLPGLSAPPLAARR